MSKKTKRTIKKVAVFVLAALAAIMAMTWIGTISNGFADKNPLEWSAYKRNPDNVITETSVNMTYNKGYGYTATLDEDDKTVTISGEVDKASGTQLVKYGSVTLPAGTYTFTSGRDGINKNTGRGGVCMFLAASGKTEAVHYADFEDAFTLSASTTYDIYISVPAEKKIRTTLYPTIASGDKAIDYFVAK